MHADLEERIRRASEEYGIKGDRDEVEEVILKTDKRRSNYYNYYTGQKWGRLENFDLTVDSSKLGIDGTAEFIAQFVGDYRKQKGV